jgi:predicted DNA-binding transcriptional regulator AlpA
MNKTAHITVDELSARELIDKKETASRLRKSVRTVDAWMKAGRLPYLKIGHKTVLFSWPDVLEKLSQYRVN